MHARLFRAALAVALGLNAAVAMPGGAITLDATSATIDDVLLDQLAAAPTERAIAYVHGTDWRDVEAAIAATAAVPISHFREVDVVAAAVTAADVTALRSDRRVTYLEGEQEVIRHTNTSMQAIRADKASRMLGDAGALNGEGTAVAVLDTGVDADHPMFLMAGGDTPTDSSDDVTKVLRQLKWVCGVGVWNLENDSGSDLSDTCLVDVSSTGGTKNDTLEQGGHGTHVASTAAGLPWTTADGRELTGVAPGATILDIAVEQGATFLGANNGMAFVLRHIRSWCDPTAPATRVWEGQPDVDAGCDPIVVTNHSYGPDGGGAYSANSIANKLARALVERGVTVSWSAGNDGGDGSTDVTNPTPKDPTPGVLMVANYDDLGSGTREGAIAGTSSRGAADDPATWPDIAAPGSNITAACAPTLAICRGLELGDLYAGTISGTSMAAPHVAGAVAILQQAALVTGAGSASSGLVAPADVERLFKQTAHQFGLDEDYTAPDDRFRGDHFGVAHGFDRGAGLLDLAAAVAALTGLPIPVDGVDLSGLPGYPQVVDPAGDAGILVSNEVTYAGSYDLTSVLLATAQGPVGSAGQLGTVGDVVIEWTVVDLEDRTTSVDGEAWELDFTVGGVVYSVQVSRKNEVGAPLGDSALLTTPDDNLELPFEFDGNVVRAVMPADLLRTTFGVTDLEGTTFSNMAAFADASFGVLLLRGDILTSMANYVYGADDNTTISAAPVTVLEDEGTATVVLTLDEARADTVTVDVALADGTGTAGVDAVLSPGTVTFAPGTRQAAVVVDIVDDTSVEDDETLEVRLANPRQASLADTSAVVTVVDDDGEVAPPAVASFAPASPTALEGDTADTPVGFTVVLDRVVTEDFVLGVDVVGGTVTVGIDVLAPTQTVTVPAGSDRATFELIVVGDRRPEIDEDAVLRVTPMVGRAAEASITVLDDDGRNRRRVV